MTASECVSACWQALFQVSSLKGLSVWRKLQILTLKIIAISGYHWGKFLAIQLTPGAQRQPGEPPFQLHGLMSQKHWSLTRPRMAVIVPVYARQQSQVTMLLHTVHLLNNSERTPEHIILVDDASPHAVPTDFSPSSGWNAGPAIARNIGLKVAKQHGAAVVCFLDDDCIPQPGWLAAMEAAQAAQPGIVCGRTVASNPSTAIGTYHDVCGTLNGRRLADGSLLYGCTCNLSMSLAVVDTTFDASFPAAAFEDVEFCVRARKKGISLVYTPTAVMMHHYDRGLWGLFCQFRRYGLFEAQMCKRHPEYLNWLWSSQEITSFCGADDGKPVKNA